jgi:plasmid stabilization system protein ParE
VRFRIRFTPEAEDDLIRLYDFLLERDDGDWTIADQALDAIRNGIAILESSPFNCRKAMPSNTFLRELIIPFGASGYVALFEIVDSRTVTVLAVRHQREDDYH